MAVTGDIQKAFLQVRVREDDRDAMCFHWRRNEQSEVETLRLCTRALFGLASSPFLLVGVIDTHLTSWEKREPEIVAKFKKELYVDDLISGSTTVSKAQEVKQKAVKIFKNAGFKLHKWHSNAWELESDELELEDDTYAKQQLGSPKGERSLLGLGWNTERDLLSVVVREEKAVTTKRGVLAKLAKIYDPFNFTHYTERQDHLSSCVRRKECLGRANAGKPGEEVEQVGERPSKEGGNTHVVASPSGGDTEH